MKASKKIVSFLLTMILCLSMGMTVFASENLYSEDNADTYIVESENTQKIYPGIQQISTFQKYRQATQLMAETDFI